MFLIIVRDRFEIIRFGTADKNIFVLVVVGLGIFFFYGWYMFFWLGVNFYSVQCFWND